MKSQSRIVHLTVHHRPDDARVFRRESRSLAQYGYEVHLLAPGAPEEVREQVRLHALPEHVRGPALIRALRRLRDAYRHARALQADLYHLHDPLLIPVGLLLSLKGARVIYDAHEDNVREAGLIFAGRPARAALYATVWRLFEALARRYLDGFVCATPAIAKNFPPDRRAVVRNYPCAEDAPEKRVAQRAPLAVYTGGLTAARGIREMVQAMELLPAELGASLRLLGSFSEPEFAAELRARPGWGSVDYRGWVDHAGVLRQLEEAQIGVVVLHPEPAFIEALPVKLFEYMAAGLAVIASDFPGWRRIVLEAGCGRVVDPKDPRTIATAFRELMEDPELAAAMGQRGREAMRGRYEWSSEFEQLHGLYARVLRKPVPRKLENPTSVLHNRPLGGR